MSAVIFIGVTAMVLGAVTLPLVVVSFIAAPLVFVLSLGGMLAGFTHSIDPSVTDSALECLDGSPHGPCPLISKNGDGSVTVRFDGENRIIQPEDIRVEPHNKVVVIQPQKKILWDTLKDGDPTYTVNLSPDHIKEIL